MPHERIEINPNIMDGKPVVRGTRVPVELFCASSGQACQLRPSSRTIPG